MATPPARRERERARTALASDDARTLRRLARAAGALAALIEQVPAIKLEDIKFEPSNPDRGIDILARLNVSDRPHVLVCEVKASGQPRHVRIALLQLRNYVAHHGSEMTPIFMF